MHLPREWADREKSLGTPEEPPNETESKSCMREKENQEGP